MPRIIPIQCDKETVIWIEAEEDVEVEEGGPAAIRQTSVAGEMDKAVATFQEISQTIRGYCSSLVHTFKELSENSRPDKATVEFGVQITAEGHAFVVKGATTANLKVTAEWNLARTPKEALNG
jgi:hypothetical protein